MYIETFKIVHWKKTKLSFDEPFFWNPILEKNENDVEFPRIFTLFEVQKLKFFWFHNRQLLNFLGNKSLANFSKVRPDWIRLHHV